MQQINVKKMGIACGLTGLLLYLGCIILMFSAGQKGTVSFFNNLLHGLDTTAIIKMDVSMLDAVLGLLQTFVLFWLIGASIAAFYNALTGNSIKK
tara:strand:+ start:2476 stop:2760 length:285 start_codon:yes stop_codon:yes gene_type:complete